MKLLFIFLLSLLILIIPLTAMADPFSDVPQGHWSYDAVNILQEKGLLEGYPDGLFKGDRPMTRYEMAMVIARVIAKLEQLQASIPKIPDLSIYATKEDLEVINKLMKEFKGELDALGVRVKNTEESLGRLAGRVDELQRVFAGGDLFTAATAIGFNKGFPGDPNNNIRFEDYGGFALSPGSAFSSRLNLNIGVNINENVTAGGTLSSYTAFGDPHVVYAWSSLPPYNSQGFSINNIYNNGFNFQTNLNKLWFHTKGDWEVNGTFGEYWPQKISPLVYYGIATPTYWGSDRCPENGIDIDGKLYGKYKFEILQANDLTWVDYGPTPLYSGVNPFNLYSSDFYQNKGYHNKMYGASGGYETDKINFDSTYLRIYEDRSSNPGIALIPKDEIILGFRGNYKICEEDKLKIFGEFNHSWFNYNLLDKTQSGAGGNALVIGGEGHIFDFDYKAQFLRIDGNYEPFNFRQIFVFKFTPGCLIGEGVYMPSVYRPDRTGFVLDLKYSLNEGKGQIFGNITCLKQIEPTIDTNPETTMGSNSGYQDFAFLHNSTDKGREFFYDIGGNYHITNEFYMETHLFSFNFSRDYAEYKYDQTRRYFHIAGSYNITDNLKVTGLYQMAQINGIDDSGNNSDIILHIPGVSLTYNFNVNTSIQVDYKYYKHNDNLNAINDYQANRISTFMQMSF